MKKKSKPFIKRRNPRKRTVTTPTDKKINPLLERAIPSNLIPKTYGDLRTLFDIADVRVWVSSTPYGQQYAFFNIPFVTFYVCISITLQGTEVIAGHVKF